MVRHLRLGILPVLSWTVHSMISSDNFLLHFSRAQDVLLLVGVHPTFPGGVVANVATGWDRHEHCHWTGNNLPFLEI